MYLGRLFTMYFILGLVLFGAGKQSPGAATKAADAAKSVSRTANPSHGQTFETDVRPFLTRNCIGCHNTEIKTANLDLSPFTDAASAVAERYVWELALGKLRAGEMPPSPLPHPSQDSVDAATRWMEQQVERYDAKHKPDPGRVTARRLNRAEYNNTVRDLLGVDLRPAVDFPVDDSGYGFDNIGDVLSLSPALMEKCLKAADRVVRAALEPAPVVKKPVLERIDIANLAGRPEVLPDDPEGAPLVTRNALIYDLRVPAEATYELSVIVNGRGHPEGPPAKLAIIMGGKQVRVVEVESDEEGVYKKRTFDVRYRLPAGVHQVGAAFLKESEQATIQLQGPQHEKRHVFSVDAMELRGPYEPKQAPLPDTHARIFTCVAAQDSSWAPCARQILNSFVYRAWRRPVTPAEIDKLIDLVNLAREQGDRFENGIKMAIKAALVSPHFLFRIEPDTVAGKDRIRVLNDHELASRLSYFLWSSMPDDTLFQLADAGTLKNPRTLLGQVKRMLANPKAAAFSENFAGQWLELRNLSAVSPDPKRFPDFDVDLRQSMKKETTLFFDYVLRGSRPITDFIDGRYTFLNERLARHYGIAGVEGPKFRRVELDGTQRSGILTQASVLTVTSYPTRTSPVLRGLWVLENVLGTPPPPPPPDIPRLEEEKVGGSLSMRQQLEKHRADPSCAVCHNKMDALGFGFENYNGVGQWRTEDGKFAVDSTGVLPGNRHFSGPAQLKTLLLEDKDSFAQCLTAKVLTYALGRGVERSDRPVVAAIAKKVAANDYRFSTMIEEVVLSAPFRQRSVDTEVASKTVASAFKKGKRK